MRRVNIVSWATGQWILGWTPVERTDTIVYTWDDYPLEANWGGYSLEATPDPRYTIGATPTNVGYATRDQHQRWHTALEPSHWGYRNWEHRVEFPAVIDLEYYDIDRGGTIVQIDDQMFVFTHDVGRYFLMDWDIYADSMIYRWLEEFAPNPSNITHHWTPTPANPFLIYEKRYETVWDKGYAEHILDCYNNDPGVFKMGNYINLSEKQYAELDELNAILPRYEYMASDTIGANDVDELIAAIKKKSKKEMGYFV